MATVREHYDVSARGLNANRIWELRCENDGVIITVHGKVCHCTEENAKYWSFYFPHDSDVSVINYLLSQPHVAEGLIQYGEPEQVIGFVNTPERQSLNSCVFTGRIYVYIDKYISDLERKILDKIGGDLGFSIKVRDKYYMDKCNELELPMAFISHDSRDKDDFVRELAKELNRRLCPVWYDEFSLQVGDSLRESIEKGLKESKKCILVLSPSFIENKGWTKKEFNSIVTREIYEKNNVILPIWHNVTTSDVYNYSPDLLDRFALSSSLGVEEVAKKLVAKIMP